MACLCNLPNDWSTAFVPTMTADVQAVPPQLSQLSDLMGQVSASASASASASVGTGLKQTLPNVSANAWLSGTLKMSGPFPPGAGPLLNAAVKLTASPVPLDDLDALYGEMEQMASSLQQEVVPQIASFRSVSWSLITNMTQAARLTLSLRAQGICPMALAGVDASFAASAGLGDPQATLAQSFSASASMSAAASASVALSPAQLGLAAQLKAIAAVSTLPAKLNLPPASDPNFAALIKQRLLGLAAARIPPMPAMPDELLAMAATLESLDTITAAFGDDALSPQGVARVNAMLSYVARLRIPVPAVPIPPPPPDLPTVEEVKLGATTAQSAAPALVASFQASAIAIPAEPLLDAMTALRAVLSRALKTELMTGTCLDCKFPIAAA